MFFNEINEKLDYFSCLGLRTLCLAIRILTEKEYKEFDEKI